MRQLLTMIAVVGVVGCVFLHAATADDFPPNDPVPADLEAGAVVDEIYNHNYVSMDACILIQTWDDLAPSNGTDRLAYGYSISPRGTVWHAGVPPTSSTEMGQALQIVAVNDSMSYGVVRFWPTGRQGCLNFKGQPTIEIAPFLSYQGPAAAQ